jgi:hypothetical protein
MSLPTPLCDATVDSGGYHAGESEQDHAERDLAQDDLACPQATPPRRGIEGHVGGRVVPDQARHDQESRCERQRKDESERVADHRSSSGLAFRFGVLKFFDAGQPVQQRREYFM